MSDAAFLDNICLLTDSYKLTHWRQYPPGTQKVYSYLESRQGAKYPETVFFGLHYLLKRYFEGAVVTRSGIDEAEEFSRLHFQNAELFNREGWEHVLSQHEGRLPVSIRAIPEGTAVSTGNLLLTIENTDPRCWWLTNHLETLLVQLWYPATVAARGRFMKSVLRSYLDETGSPEDIDLKLHDFGFRGVSCPEQAAVGGAAHLVNFRGTDNLAGILLLRHYYGAAMAGFSIPASEHSTITAWGEAHEVDAMRNMLTQFPQGTIACVSDSYDISRAVRDYWGGALKSLVEAREGVLVVRPDSGPPPESVCNVLSILGERFGARRNDKGYKILPKCVRVIQGDGIDDETMREILEEMKKQQWSADNVAFGSGGGLLQKLDRDTQSFALKCSYVEVDGVGRDVFKRPATDSSKASKRGRLKLVYSEGWQTVAEKAPGADQLQEVFRDGRVLNAVAFEEVRKRAGL
jgi:nicotinamide phosphoribosyltransferase